MPKIVVNERCYQRLQRNAEFRMTRGFAKVANGWEIELSQATLDLVLMHAVPGESIGETVQRVVALTVPV